MPGLYTRIVAGILFPLHERLKGHDTVRVHREMEGSQWFSSRDLGALQASRLRELLVRVGETVPYYRRLFAKHGFAPHTVTSAADLSRLPLLTKSLIRKNFDELRAEGATGLSRFNTGGSTGEPLIFLLSNERVVHDVAAKWRATRWWDVDIGDREIVVWGSPIELGAQDALRTIRDRILRTNLLPAFEMSESKIDGFLDTIQRAKPAMLFGYPSALAHIAQHAAARGRRMDDLGIKVAFVTSERLYDNQRGEIERIFGCRVANGYGGRDAGFIAHECPSGAMHITAEDIVVEIIASDGSVLPPGQSGEIVVTHLATRDFPFVRYRTGDLGSLSAELCVCGRGLPVLQELQGRATDLVVAQNGTVMHGLALIYVLRDLHEVRAFKIIQESLSRTRVLVLPEAAFSAQTSERIVREFKQRLGSSVEICVERVESIAPERSGKYRYVVSHVSGASHEASGVSS